MLMSWRERDSPDVMEDGRTQNADQSALKSVPARNGWLLLSIATWLHTL